jgi:hypothetical protein
MQNNFIIRNHEDYLRAHVTVLRRNPEELGSETQPDHVTKSNRHKRPGLNRGRKTPKLTSFPIR